jgi:hypothetical protein
MTVSSSIARVVHIANGSSVFFSSAPIEGLAADNVVVTLTSTGGVTTTQVLGTDYTLSSAGVTFTTAPAAGTVVTIRRVVELLQPDEFPTNSPFPAEVAENRFDQVVFGLQQAADNLARAFQYGPMDASATPVLPVPAARASRLLGFNAAGGIQLYPVEAGTAQGVFLQDGAGAVLRTVQSKFTEMLSVADFGAAGDGQTDDTNAIQAAFNAASSLGRMVLIPPGTWNVSSTVTLLGGARGLIMQGAIRYTGAAPTSVLVLGSGGATRNGEKLYVGLDVFRATQSDWSSEADIGITVRNVDASTIELRRVQGFTIGMRTLGDQRGVEDSTFFLGRIVDNKIGLDIWCATASAWNTSNRYYGGHFACSSGVNASQDRFGVRFGKAPGAYNNHNRHVFDAPNFELQQAGGNVAIPFLNETNGSAIHVRSMRMEGCSPIAARHTAGAQDCEYDVAWTNTYLITIDYTATANRCGNAVFNRHRAAASRFQRFLAGVPNVRAAAFRHSSTEIGVEGLTVISTSTTTATALPDFCFNGLSGLTPTDRAITLSSNRGLGWVVETHQVKEFALAHWLAGGAQGGRLFVRVFDDAGNVRENIPNDVLFSIGSASWNSASKGWSGGATMDDATLNRRMTLRVGPDVAYAQIGIVGFDTSITVQALRLYALPEAAPGVLNGTPLLGGSVIGSGQREFVAEVTWDLPSLASGATSLLDVTVNGARVGDLASASLATSSRFFELDATVWSNDTVRVMARNISGSTIDLGPETLSVQVTKRRVP